VQLFRKLVVAVLLTGALPALAADIAVLTNGFEIRHVRREAIGQTTRLYVSDGSFVDVPTAQIAQIQQEEYVPSAPAPAPAVASNGKLDVHALAGKAADDHQIDQDFIEAVIRAESAGNPRARSAKGAQGLMQLMPKTADQLGVKDAYDPAANIDAGTRHLRVLLEQYNGDAVKALAAYNAGAQKVSQYHGVPPFPETQAYIRRIIREYNAKKLAQQRAAAKQKAAAKKTTAALTPSPTGE